MKKLIGWGLAAIIVLLLVYNSGSSDSSVDSYSDEEPDYDQIIDSSEYQELEAKLEEVKSDLEEAHDCIDTLHDQLDNIHTKAGLAWGNYDDMEDALFSIRVNTDPECGY